MPIDQRNLRVRARVRYNRLNPQTGELERTTEKEFDNLRVNLKEQRVLIPVLLYNGKSQVNIKEEEGIFIVDVRRETD